jgi:dTDP-4-dehydrorhamnose 3,5-epimerase
LQIEPGQLPGILLLTPRKFEDARGWFFESFNQRVFEEAAGRAVSFVQDNQSYSHKGVLRGLHYQLPQPQGKLVRALVGAIYDVVVDIRKSSPTFGRWEGYELSAANGRQLWVPEGFAHGFYTLTEGAEVMYKTTDYWAPGAERCLKWDDPALGIDWKLAGEPILSDKDRAGLPLAEALLFD